MTFSFVMLFCSRLHSFWILWTFLGWKYLNLPIPIQFSNIAVCWEILSQSYLTVAWWRHMAAFAVDFTPFESRELFWVEYIIIYQFWSNFGTLRHIMKYFHNINSLCLGDVIGQPTLAQVIACCLPAPSHYLDQYWLIIGNVPWNSPESNFSPTAQAIFLHFSSKIILLKLFPNFHGTNGLKNGDETLDLKTKWPPFYRPSFKIDIFLFLVWKSLYFTSNFTEICGLDKIGLCSLLQDIYFIHDNS